MARKIIVEVVLRQDTEGIIHPLEIAWEDGQRFEIDNVYDMRRAASMKAGGQGIRYTCLIHGTERYLFYDDIEKHWFVEGR